MAGDSEVKLTISEKSLDHEITFLKFDGMVDSESETGLQAELGACYDQGKRRFVLDFSGVTYLNSRGLGVIAALLRKVRKDNGDVKLINLSDSIRELFMITKLNNVFSICDSVEEAVNSFG